MVSERILASSIDRYPKHLDWLRYMSAFLLLLYATSKLAGKQFSVAPEMALRPIGTLSGRDLAWYFFGYSHIYATLLGLIQLAGALLLLFRKTALAGAALLLPVMTNIILINVFYFITWGAVCTSALIFAALLAVLWHERQALLRLFWTDQESEPLELRKRYRTIAGAVVLTAMVLMAVGLWLSASRVLAK